MEKIRSHKDLHVWKLSIEMCEKVYSLTKDFPEYEKFGIASQINRAVVSISANIAEGAVFKEIYLKTYIKHLYIALGSLAELETLLEICLKIKLIEDIETYAYDN